MSVKQFATVAALAAVTGVGGLAATSALAQITIPTVTIANPGNAPDPLTGSLYGSVASVFRIGTTEVTNAQYAAFLNAKAASDPRGLYNGNMAGFFGGITRSGSPGLYTYATISGRANNPVTWVSFWDACRFANWLHNGQGVGGGSGDTETGAYTLTAGGISANTITRNAGWRWAVTSENEWYKAAYHQPASAGGDSDNYWFYTTSSNSAPTAAQANILSNNTVAVGLYTANSYGTFDMGGNVGEWTEAIISSSLSRGIRGGGFNDLADGLRADSRFSESAQTKNGSYGFRVSQAMTLPTPCTPSDVAGPGQSLGADGQLTADDIIVFLNWFFAGDLRADVAGPGQATVPDTQFTADDIIVFLNRFFAGC